MKKAIQITFLVSTITLFSYQANSATQAKPGSKCTKVASTQLVSGKKFTCIKSGTKLIWNKGVAVAASSSPGAPAAPASQAKPNPFDSTPFPDEFTRDQMVEATLVSFDNYVKQSNSKQPFKLIIDKDFQHKTKEITKLVGNVYASLPFPSDYPTVVFVVTRDRQFLEKSVMEYSDFYKPGQSQMVVKPCLNCSWVGWASTDLGLSNVIPHEIFHTWQKSVYKWESRNINADPSNSLIPPVWLDEGGAEFFGNIFYRSVEDYYPGSLVKFKPYRLQDYRTREISGELPYSLGRLASEYIVASKGYEKFLSIYSNVGQGQDFPTAFESAMGISLEKFYEKFNSNLKKML
jgi:hypothetical protein